MALPTAKAMDPVAAKNDGAVGLDANSAAAGEVQATPATGQANVHMDGHAPAPAPAAPIVMPKVVAPYNEDVDLHYPEIRDDDMCSDDDEAMDQKACFTMKHLNEGRFDGYWKGPKHGCPFCTRKITANYPSIMMHAETSSNDPKRIGQTVNPHAFMAKHRAYGVFLRRKYNQMIEAGEIPPPKTKEEKEANKRLYTTMAREEKKAANKHIYSDSDMARKGRSAQ